MKVETTYFRVGENGTESTWTETVDIGKPELYHRLDPEALVDIVREELEQVHSEKEILRNNDVGEIISITAA